MKIERTKNATRNILFGILLKVYQIIVPFLMRTAMIYFMGVQYLGLNSLFTSILQVLNLAELGVGSAMVYSMYKPIAEDDTVTICALMRLYRIYYRVIGVVIAGAGLALTPFIPRLISGDIPSGINIYILYLINLGATALSYWLFAYKNCLFQAHQRVDVTSKISLIISTVQYGLQFGTIIFLKNYYIFVIVVLATQALTNIVTAHAATVMYPGYKPTGKLEQKIVREIRNRIKDLFTSKIGLVIVNSADAVVISAFLGLEMLAVYQNYFFVLNAVIGLVAILFNSCIAGIGNSIIVESSEKNLADLKKFTFLIAWIAGFCSCCLLNLFQPFMEIWVGKKLMLNFMAVIFFCLYYYVYEINQLLNAYKDAGGIWHQDRFRPLATALTNLVLNLIMVQFWGIYGVLLSTVISTSVVGMPWLFHNLFTTIFVKKQLSGYLKRLIRYTITVLFACVISFALCRLINFGLWPDLIIRLGICCIVPNLFFTICYHNMKEFNESILLVDKMLKGKLNLKRFVR